MKKIFAAMSAVLCVVIALLGGCENTDVFEQKEYVCDASEVANIILDLSSREVQVAPSPDGNIRIEYFESERQYYRIDTTADTLTMALVLDKDVSDFFGKEPDLRYRTISVLLPQGALASLRIATSGENVSAAGVAADDISIQNNGGDIVLEQIDVGKTLDLSAKNGNISGSVLGGWDDFSISCTVKKGDCNLADKSGGTKRLTIDCNNGDVDIDLIK